MEMMKGIWTLTAPNGDRYQAETPIRCCREEQKKRIPKEVEAKRLLDFLNNEDEDKEYVEAERIASWMWNSFYRQDSTDWEPCDSLMGVLSQIDNMLTGLERIR